MASISPVSATTVVYFFNDSNNVIALLLSFRSETLDLPAIACCSHLAGFKLSDLGQAATMPIGAAELRVIVVGAIPCCQNRLPRALRSLAPLRVAASFR